MRIFTLTMLFALVLCCVSCVLPTEERETRTHDSVTETEEPSLETEEETVSETVRETTSEIPTETVRDPVSDGFPNEAESDGTKRY